MYTKYSWRSLLESSCFETEKIARKTLKQIFRRQTNVERLMELAEDYVQW
jgi:hypothetical protein